MCVCSQVCTYDVLDHHSHLCMYDVLLTITITLNIFSLLKRCYLGGEPRDSHFKVNNLSSLYTGFTREFDYYLVAYKYNVRDVVSVMYMICIHMI